VLFFTWTFASLYCSSEVIGFGEFDHRRQLLLDPYESSSSTKDMNEKIKKFKDRRGWVDWNMNRKEVKAALSEYQLIHGSKKRPNILFMFADDLGYGDTSVKPFYRSPRGPGNHTKESWLDDGDEWPCDEGGHLTPNLEMMAANGAILTNMHSASPVCSPSRVSVLTSLFPWRLNAMNAFELGQDLTQRNNYLPQVVTGPEIFRGAGYYTVHSGKWHLGGMREEYRKDRVQRDICVNPGPHQQGFEEYISMLDGNNSPRYALLHHSSTLHSKGYNYRIKDDVPLAPVSEPVILSDIEAQDGIDMIQEHMKSDPAQPWYLEIWFNAPHSPYEIIPAGLEVFNKHHGKTTDYWKSIQCHHHGQAWSFWGSVTWKYRTMVSGMDASIGRVLKFLKDSDLEKDTLVVFTSDNGPEHQTSKKFVSYFL